MSSIHRTLQISLRLCIVELYPLITLLMVVKQLCKVQLQRVLLRTFPFSPKFYTISCIWKEIIWCFHKVKVASHLQILKRTCLEVSTFRTRCLIKEQIKLNLHLDLLFLAHTDLIQLIKVIMKRALLTIMMTMKIKITRGTLDILRNLFVMMIWTSNLEMSSRK